MSNWSNFGRLSRRAGLSAIAGLSCFYFATESTSSLGRSPWSFAITWSIWVRFIIQVRKFGSSPEKFGTKTCKICVNFTQLQNLIANICGTSQDIQYRKDVWSRTILPRLAKSPENFGPTTTNRRLIKYSVLTQIDFFGRLHFCPWGCCPLKFLRVLEIRHERGRDPLKNFRGEKYLKFGLKFSVCVSITLGLVGLTLRNFTRRSTSHEAGVITWVQILEGLTQQNLGGKNVQNFDAISDNIRLWLRISQNGLTERKSEGHNDHDQLQPLSINWHLAKNWWTLIHQQKSYRSACLPTQVDFYFQS